MTLTSKAAISGRLRIRSYAGGEEVLDAFRGFEVWSDGADRFLLSVLPDGESAYVFGGDWGAVMPPPGLLPGRRP
ncbi:hypothetical protein [Streptomyces sp. R35]|uniref:Uncharacterized protein n=1 Tax=Streptomyces sp. R35 TaxID=3238630 RepID=A0AB39SM30_9ACTN